MPLARHGAGYSKIFGEISNRCRGMGERYRLLERRMFCVCEQLAELVECDLVGFSIELCHCRYVDANNAFHHHIRRLLLDAVVDVGA